MKFNTKKLYKVCLRYICVKIHMYVQNSQTLNTSVGQFWNFADYTYVSKVFDNSNVTTSNS